LINFKVELYALAKTNRSGCRSSPVLLGRDIPAAGCRSLERRRDKIRIDLNLAVFALLRGFKDLPVLGALVSLWHVTFPYTGLVSLKTSILN